MKYLMKLESFTKTYIKTYEAITSKTSYGFDKYLTHMYDLLGTGIDQVTISIEDVLDYLKAEYFINSDYRKLSDEEYGDIEISSRYDINVIDFLKEIFLDKEIEFTSLNRLTSNPYVKGKVENLSSYGYKDQLFMQIKIYDKKGGWYLVKLSERILVSNYDAEDKPLHKEVELKKEAEKYNL